MEFLYCQTVQQSQAQGKIGLLEQAGIVSATSKMTWFIGILPCLAMSKNYYILKNFFSSFSESMSILKNGGQLQE